jgi:hypothetical protein
MKNREICNWMVRAPVFGSQNLQARWTAWFFLLNSKKSGTHFRVPLCLAGKFTA